MAVKKTKDKKTELKTAKKSFNFKFSKLLIISGSFLMILILSYAVFSAAYSGKIYPKTFVAGFDLGGKTVAEAQALLQTEISGEPFTLELATDAKSYKINTKELEVKYNYKLAAEEAYKVGRSGDFSHVAKEKLLVLGGGNYRYMSYEVSQDKLSEFLNKITSELDDPEQNATIKINDLKPQITAQKSGKRVDLDLLKANIADRMGYYRKEKIAIVVKDSFPEITVEKAQLALEQTNKILSGKINFQNERKELNLEVSELAGWLEFSPGQLEDNFKNETLLIVKLNQDKLDKYVNWIADQVEVPAKDAKFEMKDGRATAFQTAQTGYVLDKEKTKNLLSETILSGGKSLVLPISVQKPTITANSAGDLGIVELVGEATTNFYGSPTNRRHNIATGAKAIHGIMVKPGEEFSTVAALGTVDASSGYLPELVIKEDRTTPEYGGGLCQVSTTLFRAVMNTGLEIVERRNHSYRVGYYEPPVGMDATIYLPKPDFRFKNTLNSYILLQSKVEGSSITFSIYGTKDGRKVEISKPVVYDITTPPAPIYVEDPKLAQGEIKKVESAHNGAKASFTYKVFDASGKKIVDQKFNSSYVPWQARYLYGPGTEVPKN